ncbi:integrase catalytic domain-containing protein [Trichonephila clavata]|uniref:Integrase catalytic domain-containing protein n=1 Tax=Trichonephila clavata TaxID=2740835 RepID=A0A8X6HSS1_TRICU|nr:integrase catalytic domain-containing protein [Trichonephila clavata]
MVISDNARTFKRAEFFGVSTNVESVKPYRCKKTFPLLILLSGTTLSKEPPGEVVSMNYESRASKNTRKIIPHLELLLTVLTEIEGTINSRPITYVGNETEEPIPLNSSTFYYRKTNHFALTKTSPCVCDSNLSFRKCLIKAFNYRENLMRSFWSRWKNEYLLNLR